MQEQFDEAHLAGIYLTMTAQERLDLGLLCSHGDDPCAMVLPSREALHLRGLVNLFDAGTWKFASITPLGSAVWRFMTESSGEAFNRVSAREAMALTTPPKRSDIFDKEGAPQPAAIGIAFTVWLALNPDRNTLGDIAAAFAMDINDAWDTVSRAPMIQFEDMSDKIPIKRNSVIVFSRNYL